MITSEAAAPNGTTLSVEIAARLVGVSTPTLRRMFDRDLPASGRKTTEGGPTGVGERRVDEAWARRKAADVAAARAAGSFGKAVGPRRPRQRTGGEQPTEL